MKLAPMATFVTWYYSLPWSVAQISRMHNTLWQYCVGGWRDHRVVFWQIDSEGVPRAAKLMAFYEPGHPKYGHRVKSNTLAGYTIRMGADRYASQTNTPS